jgi:hypothetical protein
MLIQVGDGETVGFQLARRLPETERGEGCGQLHGEHRLIRRTIGFVYGIRYPVGLSWRHPRTMHEEQARYYVIGCKAISASRTLIQADYSADVMI